MERWGYIFHNTPKVGDLVLFLDDEGEPTHMGIIREGNLIESKWGREMNTAYLHRLEDTPDMYGTKVIYCSPPENLEKITRDLRDEIARQIRELART